MTSLEAAILKAFGLSGSHVSRMVIVCDAEHLPQAEITLWPDPAMIDDETEPVIKRFEFVEIVEHDGE